LRDNGYLIKFQHRSMAHLRNATGKQRVKPWNLLESVAMNRTEVSLCFFSFCVFFFSLYLDCWNGERNICTENNTACTTNIHGVPKGYYNCNYQHVDCPETPVQKQ
jgi:hypothetical protein